MAQLVGGVLGRIQSGSGKVLLDQLVNSGGGDTLVILAGNKQGVFIDQTHGVAFHQPVIQRLTAGLVQIDHAFLVSFAQHAEHFAPVIGYIQSHQLRNTQPTVEKQSKNAVIAGMIFAIHIC